MADRLVWSNLAHLLRLFRRHYRHDCYRPSDKPAYIHWRAISAIFLRHSDYDGGTTISRRNLARGVSGNNRWIIQYLLLRGLYSSHIFGVRQPSVSCRSRKPRLANSHLALGCLCWDCYLVYQILSRVASLPHSHRQARRGKADHYQIPHEWRSRPSLGRPTDERNDT